MRERANRSSRPAADPLGPDRSIVDLLRTADGLGIGELASRMGVTATAIRQRLDRLMRAGLVGRTTVAAKVRGRPSHAYSLTEKGRKTGGDNFRDLALVLWSEIRGIQDASIRRGLIARIAAGMAGMYRERVSGDTPSERLESVARVLRDRRISCSVDPAGVAPGSLPVLTSFSCPFPDLAEQDPGICAAERLMLQDLVGSSVRLSACRLDGDPCCRFTVGGGACSHPG
jgi:DeoR family suf operon transcriptional repressor